MITGRAAVMVLHKILIENNKGFTCLISLKNLGTNFREAKLPFKLILLACMVFKVLGEMFNNFRNNQIIAD
ncbi:MAG: hypothetical protein ACI8YP_002617 [Algoriphagus sp.]|jgi:hypothetical protein